MAFVITIGEDEHVNEIVSSPVVIGICTCHMESETLAYIDMRDKEGKLTRFVLDLKIEKKKATLRVKRKR